MRIKVTITIFEGDAEIPVKNDQTLATYRIFPDLDLMHMTEERLTEVLSKEIAWPLARTLKEQIK